MSPSVSRPCRRTAGAARWFAVGLALALATILFAGRASSSTQFQFSDVTISNVRLNGGTNVLEVAAGTLLDLSLDYALAVPGCPGCLAQITVGFADGDPQTCVYDGLPGTGASGSATVQLQAPSTPGIHRLVFDRSLDYGCALAIAAGWASGPPNRPEQTIGFVTVFSPGSFLDVNLSNVQLNGGTNALVLPVGTATFDMSLDYTVAVPWCPGCIAQVTVGFADGAPQACIYDGVPSSGVSGSTTVQLQAPAAPGTYSIVFDRSLDFSCPLAIAAGWANGLPNRPEQVIGTVTVTTPTSFADATISNVRLNGGTNALEIPTGTASFELTLDYSLSVPGCPGCLAQILVGLAGGNPQDCAYDGLPGPGASGSATVTLTAPQAPGSYSIVFDRSLDYSCAQAIAAGWPNGPPNRPEQVLGTVTVVTARSFSEVTIANVHLNGGPSTLAVPVGTMFDLSLDYAIAVTGCPGCIAQIQVGFADGSPLTCVYNGIPGSGASGSASATLQAPWTAGVYSVVFDRSLYYGCSQSIAGGWWSGAPNRLEQVLGTVVVNGVAGVGETPTLAFGLRPNAPNPFRDVTVLHFDLPRAGVAELSILDVAGRHIRTLLAESTPAGRHEIAWDGRDDEGRRVRAGVYYSRLAFDRTSVSRRLVIVSRP